MPVEILRLTEAARRLGISTLDMVQLVHNRQIDYVIVDGTARIPEDVVDEYRRKAS